MEFQRVVERRRMVRAFDPQQPIPTAVRERVLRNALRAPSAGFSQGAAYLVLDGGAQTSRWWAVTAGTRPENDWLARMRQAPLLISCWCSEVLYRQRYAESDKADADPFSAPYWYVDGGMGALLMLQTVIDEGLGACFFGVPRARVEAVRAEFAIPSEWAPVGVLAVGYPDRDRDRAGRSRRRGRRPDEEVIHMGQWGSAPTVTTEA